LKGWLVLLVRPPFAQYTAAFDLLEGQSQLTDEEMHAEREEQIENITSDFIKTIPTRFLRTRVSGMYATATRAPAKQSLKRAFINNDTEGCAIRIILVWCSIPTITAVKQMTNNYREDK
jgi:hypothetical protein